MLDRRELVRLAALAAGAQHFSPLVALTLEPKPLTRRGAPKKVLVLGAGLAGLSAAWQLSEAGHDVTILEAQRRPGGRVLTLREPFSDGLYCEAGAGRIPETHNLTLHYVALCGLSLEPFYPSQGKQVASFHGKRISYASLKAIDMNEVPLELRPEERQLGLEGIDEKYVARPGRQLDDLEAPGWPGEALARIDSLTYREYLRSLGASPDAIAYLALGFEATSALDSLRDSTHHHTRTLSKIRGGNDLLPKALAGKLSSKIRYGSPVTAIRQDGEGVEAVMQVHGESDRPQTVRGDVMICTIPFTVLRRIPVAPAFPEDKRSAINTLSSGSVTRIELQTRRRFWEDRGENGFSTIDQPMEIWNPTFDQPGRRGILQAYIYEDLSRRTCGMSEQERIRFALETLEPVQPGLREHFEGGVSKCWDEDPWARGAYTIYLPGQLSHGLPAIMARPEGRIHFAGEHVSPYPGWMQGALWSGHRAADAVNEGPLAR